MKKFFAAVMTFFTSISFTLPTFAQSKFTSTVMHRLPVDVLDNGGTLLFSDSPEYVRMNGILYTDTVKGDARILFYHLNDTGVKKKLAVVVENVSSGQNHVEITRGGVSAPSRNFLSVGKASQSMYMQDNFHDMINLNEGERKLFQEYMDRVTINPGQLVYGVFDFHTDKPVKIYVMMYPQEANPLLFVDYAPILPKDKYCLRGTFRNMNRTINLRKTYDPDNDGIGYILIGDDVTDFFKKGIDATDGKEVINYGNYGINYFLNFRTKSMTRFCLSPLGGHYAGAMRFYHAGQSGTIETPADRIYFGDKTPHEPESVRKAREEGMTILTNRTELSELGSYNGKVTFEYSPPGASNLPVNIVLLPTDE